MSSDAETHRELLARLRAATGEGDGSFELAVVRAFEHVFDHLERPNSHVLVGGPDGKERPLNAGESPTLR